MRTATSDRSDAAARQQHGANAAMFLAKGPPDIMQRLSGFPTSPDVTLLDCGKTKPFPWPHVNTTSGEQIYISGVASTYRIHRGYRRNKVTLQMNGFPTYRDLELIAAEDSQCGERGLRIPENDAKIVGVFGTNPIPFN